MEVRQAQDDVDEIDGEELSRQSTPKNGKPGHQV